MCLRMYMVTGEIIFYVKLLVKLNLKTKYRYLRLQKHNSRGIFKVIMIKV
jgi:hypothetical protein